MLTGIYLFFLLFHFYFCREVLMAVKKKKGRVAFGSSPRKRAPVRRRRRYRRRTTRNSPVSSLDPGQKFTLLQVDPFLSQGLGAKVPDTNTVPSMTTCLQEITAGTLSTATNQKCWAFNPVVTHAFVAATEGAAAWSWGADWAANATNMAKRTDYAAQIELDRPVAHAVRVSSGVAPTSATGFVHLAVSTNTNFNFDTWPFPTTVALMSGCQWYKRVTLASLTQSPITIVNKFIDETGFRYKSPMSAPMNKSDANAFQAGARSWGTLLVAIEGGNSISPLSFETILHTEAIPKFSGTILGSPSAAYSPASMSSTATMVSNTDFSHTEATQQSHLQQASNALSAGAADVGNSIFNNVIIPGLYHAGGAAAAAAAGGLGIIGVNNANRLQLN